MACIIVNLPQSHPWNHHHHQFQSNLTITSSLAHCSSLTKQGLKFLSTLSLKAAGDPSAAGKLIGKFVTSSPKSISLNALSHLLSPDTTYPHLTPLSLPMYLKIKEATWFEYNPKLVSELSALLDKQGKYQESELLVSEAVSRLSHSHRDLAQFRCSLVESHAKQGSIRGFDSSYNSLRELLQSSSSTYVKRRGFESSIGGLCTMDRPQEAESLMEDMRVEGLKPTVFEFRSVIYSYGQLGLFDDMIRIIDWMEREGFVIDTVCSNMVLSSYGTHNELSKTVTWLRKMRSSGVGFSIRTYNSVLKSCPSIAVVDPERVPLSVAKLGSILSGDEAEVVEELVVGLERVLEEVAAWGPREAKLDLHGMHLGTAYLVVLVWVEEMRRRLRDVAVPAEVVVVCGSGKHSEVRGVSPVKLMVKEIMVRMGSPLKIDRKNVGCFVAKGKTVKDWLCVEARD